MASAKPASVPSDLALRCVTPGPARLRLGGNLAWQAKDDRSFDALMLDVSGMALAPDLPRFRTERPCYLSDTRAETSDATLFLSVGDWGGGFPEDPDKRWNRVPAGALVNVIADSLNEHAIHLHVNHFQLTSIGARDPNYFRVGDWHDTLFEPSRSAGLRFYTDRFAGPMVVHCHNYVHSDQGMMKVIEIEGADGAAVRAADDACLRDGTRGYALLAPSPAPTGAPVAPTTKPTAAPPPVVAPPADGSDGAAAAPLGVAAAVLALLLA